VRLFTFEDGEVKPYVVRKGNKIELTKGRYILVSDQFPAYMRHITRGTLVFAWDVNQWYLLPEGGREFTAEVIARAREIRYPNGVDVLYSSLGEKKVFLLKFKVGGSIVIDDWYVFWNGKDLNVMDASDVEWLMD
jgi:hypothetical protein